MDKWILVVVKGVTFVNRNLISMLIELTRCFLPSMKIRRQKVLSMIPKTPTTDCRIHNSAAGWCPEVDIDDDVFLSNK